MIFEIQICFRFRYSNFGFLVILKFLASLSLDLDNQWSYMKTHGDAGWKEFPSYYHIFIPQMLDVLDRLNLKITFFIVANDIVFDHGRTGIQLYCWIVIIYYRIIYNANSVGWSYWDFTSIKYVIWDNNRCWSPYIDVRYKYTIWDSPFKTNILILNRWYCQKYRKIRQRKYMESHVSSNFSGYLHFTLSYGDFWIN